MELARDPRAENEQTSILFIASSQECLKDGYSVRPIQYLYKPVDRAELAQALEEVDSPCLLGMCDVVAPAAAGEPVENYLDLLGKKLAHLHLVDSDGHSDDHLIPGDGILPLPELLRELAERGYQGKATIELVTAYLSEPAL